jgi:hypothetical protein
MNNPDRIKNYIAESAIGQYRIGKFGSTDDMIVQANAASDSLIGVCCQPGGAAIGDRADMVLTGATEVEYGGSVARGDRLTTDASGRAVTASPSTGVINNIIGLAMESGIAGTIGSVLFAQSQIKG